MVFKYWLGGNKQELLWLLLTDEYLPVRYQQGDIDMKLIKLVQVMIIFILLSVPVSCGWATVSCSSINGNRVLFPGELLVVPADVPADTLLLEASNVFNSRCRVSAKARGDTFSVDISDWTWFKRLDASIDKNMYFIVNITKRQPVSGTDYFDSRDKTKQVALTKLITCKTSLKCTDSDGTDFTQDQTFLFNYKVSLYKRRGADMDWHVQPGSTSSLWIADLVESGNENLTTVAPVSIGGFNKVVWAECGVTLNPIPPVNFDDVNKYESTGAAGGITTRDVNLSVSKVCNSVNYDVSLQFNPVQGTVLPSDKTMLVPADNNSVAIRLRNKTSGSYITYGEVTKGLFPQLVGSGVHNASLSAELFWNPEVVPAKRIPGKFTAAVSVDVVYY
ncbi:fimbrial protein [Citrobacter koseri]|uniref:fimbrial protein n=1 Tax=Citrobacter koseri TaxID=545 RepID=UPI0028BED207|nr:fimbrial protein [Citrobacter koseri]MDT7487304.1 fimbrial protein [Citrobacter koseri]